MTPCCICRGNTYSTLYTGVRDFFEQVPGTWNLVVCEQCGLVQLDPMPTGVEIAGFYAHDYVTHAEVPKLAATETQPLKEKLKVWQHTSSYKRRYLFYLDDCEPGAVLEVGCGNGANLLRLQDRGWDVWGTEPDGDAAAQAGQAIGPDRIFCGNIEHCPYPVDKFDAVLMIHVLEHVEQPEAFLRACWRHLRPGGRGVVITPNVSSLWHALFGRTWFSMSPPYHVRLFSPRNLPRLVAASGLDDAATYTEMSHSTYTLQQSLQVTFAKRTGPDFTTSPWRQAIVGILQILGLGVSQLLPMRGEECIVLGTKPG